jgi:diacylglycerol kinase (ATP)
LVLCITVVQAAELFNSALECLAKAIDTNHNPHIADALDLAGGAVLVTAIGAATVGAIVFVARAIAMFG